MWKNSLVNLRQIRFALTLLLICIGCVDPYSPVLNIDEINALVIDGHIDSNGTATVKLSRAIPLASFAEAPPENGATVTISSSSGETFTLAEEEDATYVANNLDVDNKTKYVLHVRLSSGSEYESDEVLIHPTPTVGKIYLTYASSNDNIEIRTDSRDESTDGTGFYLWDCVETYEYRAQLFSKWKRENGIPLQRHKGEYVDTCWHTIPVPTSIYTTSRLSENTISGHLLTSISKFSKKVSMRYSLLVRQRAISEQEFTYRNLLDKTVNGQSSIFAEIPGAVLGNVHSLNNPAETVLGYFRGQQITEKRVFIDHASLPLAYQADPPPEACDVEGTCPTNVPVNGPSTCIEIQLLSETNIILTTVEEKNSVVYYFAKKECGDCRTKGGTTEKPLFWRDP